MCRRHDGSTGRTAGTSGGRNNENNGNGTPTRIRKNSTDNTNGNNNIRIGCCNSRHRA